MATRLFTPFALILFVAAVTCTAEPQATPAYRDFNQPQDARIDDLLARMTVEEKASLMANATPGVPRLGIPKYDWWSEALHGVANAGNATVFPQAIGLAAMWDEALQQEIAHVIGVEGRAKFKSYKGTAQEGAIFRGLTFWSPNINIFRDPRWGRGQETYGEDPFLTARLGVAFVRGLQGDDPRYLLAAAGAKHYAVHSGPESLRHTFDVTPLEADLHETYLPAFEALVREARVEIVMTAYNALNGTPCSISPFLYGLLKDWGFNGHVTSDCGSIDDLVQTFKRAADPVEADVLTTRAGMHTRCGGDASPMVTAVKQGKLSEAELDARARPLLRTMFRLGFFDTPERVPYNEIPASANETASHGVLALKAAREAMVLLKNDGLLPLDPKKIKRVAVIGPNASSVPALLGNYNGTPSAPVTVLAGLKAALEPLGVTVQYAHGVDYATRTEQWRPIPHPWFRAEYFANPSLTGEPIAQRVERPLCLACVDHGPGGLPKGVPDQGISARWNGEIQTTLAGEYQFRVRGRGGFRLFFGEKCVLDSWTPAPGTEGSEREVSVAESLPDNASVSIRLEYLQGQGPSSVSLEWKTPPPNLHEAEALAAAREADVVIYVGGISAQLEGEEMNVDYDGYNGGDRTQIELPALQQKLLEKLHAAGKPLVVVNLSGSAVALPWVDEHANALLQAWYPGQAGGVAVADVVLGHYNPAGRLPVTFYRSTEDLPSFTDYGMSGRTYRYFSGQPLYAFGHGLSYSRFEYRDLYAQSQTDGSVQVKLTVVNKGERAGDEVVQLYARPPAASHPRERLALCGFARIPLQKGETRRVEINVPASALRRWNESSRRMEIPSGRWTLHAGASSVDLRLETGFDR
jgi:beta-glucosidase